MQRSFVRIPLCRHTHGADLLDQILRNLSTQIAAKFNLFDGSGLSVIKILIGERGVGRHIGGRGEEVVHYNLTRPSELFVHNSLVVADFG